MRSGTLGIRADATFEGDKRRMPRRELESGRQRLAGSNEVAAAQSGIREPG
jgi:hypothetical protein